MKPRKMEPRKGVRPLYPFSLNIVQPGQLNPQYFPVQKQQARQRLVLRSRSHFPANRQIGQKRFHMLRPQVSRLPLAMKQNMAFNPIDIGPLGAQAVML